MSDAKQLFMDVSLSAQKQSLDAVEALNTFRGPQGPQGTPGSINNLVINGKESVQVDGKNTINLTPEDVGALPSNGTAVNANQLNGKGAEFYATAESVTQLSQQITEQKESISDSWTSGKTYAVRDYVIYGNRLYKCKTAHTAGNTFDVTYWKAVSLSEELDAVDKKLFVKQKTTGPDGMASITLKTTISKRVLFFYGTANNFPCMGVVMAKYEYEHSAYAMIRQFDFLEGTDEFSTLTCSLEGDVVTINMPVYGVYNFMATYEIE